MSYPLDTVLVNSIAALVAALCAVILFRISLANESSRFMRYFAASIAVNIAIRLGDASVVGISDGAAWVLKGIGEPTARVHRLEEVRNIVNGTWNNLDVVLSFISTFFLFYSWALLRAYPGSAVDKVLKRWLASVFGIGNLLALVQLLVMVHEDRSRLAQVLVAIDILTSAAAVWLMGWQLHRTLGSRVKNSVVRVALPTATSIFYFTWGALQLAYPVGRGALWYGTAMLGMGTGSVVLTTILCALAFEWAEVPSNVHVHEMPGVKTEHLDQETTADGPVERTVH